MSAVGELGKVVAAKIADEGTLQSFTSNLDGHVQDPGIESYVEIRAAAGVRAVGANGNITAAAHGDSTRLPAGMRDALIEQLKQPISDEQRAAILEILGWNRTQTP